ncbi:hypothetical protein QJ854_gp941 [Moumouvirus goulette]|uniref:Uncharacterized protein n=1 Tax=Moumouvirus goulette TaxID=1247379 RepID=M1PLP5_9VIRU|nr:hypothetical protein QJ854_gp941 [Moumouvirus goulette]AGF84841.1 hypothetical protein glt_00032 [Moumouvirus goulette]
MTDKTYELIDYYTRKSLKKYFSGRNGKNAANKAYVYILNNNLNKKHGELIDPFYFLIQNPDGKIYTFKILSNKIEKIDEQSHFEIPKNSKNTNSFVLFDECKNKIYYTHDNGHRPFQVIISNNKSIKIIVRKYDDCSDNDTDDNNDYSDNDLDNNLDNNLDSNEESKNYKIIVVKIDKFIGYWYGYDSSINQMHGNTILIKITTNQYMYIGPEIYEFETHNDEIIDYVSPVGNSDVPYPVAYGKKFVYFMDDKKKVKKSFFELDICPANAEDIFVEFDKMLSDKSKIIDYSADSTTIEERQI